MSIATLKRKTQTKYNNMSVGQDGFSLNGTRRSAGYVGQDTLGRSLIRSLAGSNGALKGHGGCCGSYPIVNIKTSPEMAALNDPSVVKSSCIDTKGLINTKYRWIRRPKPFANWKPSDYSNIGDQGSYIDHLARTTIANSCHDTSGNTLEPTCCILPGSQSYSVNWKKPPPISKPNSFLAAVSQSDHIRELNKKCGKNDVFYYRKNTKIGSTFACGT